MSGGAAGSKALNLLLFSVAGVRFGIDAEQAAGMNAYRGEEDEDLFWLHEVIDFGERPVQYRAPVLLSVAAADGIFRVVIDEMEEIDEAPLEEIRPLPSLLEPFVLPKGLWGVLLRGDATVLLLDFERLLRNRKDKICLSIAQGGI